MSSYLVTQLFRTSIVSVTLEAHNLGRESVSIGSNERTGRGVPIDCAGKALFKTIRRAKGQTGHVALGRVNAIRPVSRGHYDDSVWTIHRVRDHVVFETSFSDKLRNTKDSVLACRAKLFVRRVNGNVKLPKETREMT